MKKSTLALLALTLAVVTLGGLASFAGHCGADGATHDAFGACEEGGANFGNTKCGGGTDVPGVGRVNATPSSGNGVQVCADNDSDQVPIQGRITVYRDSAGQITIASDGDKDNASGGQSWTRIDVNPTASSCRVRQRRSSGGWSGAGGGSQPTNPDGGSNTPQLANNCAA